MASTTPPAVTPRLLDEARDLQRDTVELRRRIHRRPELGLHLPETQATVLEALDGLGLAVETGTSTTSVVATLEGARPGPTILLRADMDALPLREDTGLDFASEVDGAMHACGHDGHVAMLVTAARMLAARRDELAGRVVFMFQPGEEGHHGARFMLEERLLDGPHPPGAAFAIHLTPTIRSGVVATRRGPFLASADVLTVTVRGRGGHASMPHDCCDPVPVACEIVGAIQSLVTRQVDAFDPAVVTVASIRAGTTSNVIPETAHLLGTLRAVSERTRSRVLDGLHRLVEGIAAAHGAEAHLEVDEGYPVTVNDGELADWARGVAAAVLGEEHSRAMPNPVMGAEDFSYVLQRVPGAMVFLGARPQAGGPVAPNHSNRMVIDEAALASGAALHCAVALSFLAERPAGG